MSKLVDKERLAKLAQALDSRMKATVAAEKERAELAEARIEGKADANAQAIAVINNAETGILKQAKNYADAIDTDLQKQIENKVEETDYLAQVKELVDADAELTKDIADLDAAVKGLEGLIGDVNATELQKAVAEATQRLDAKDTELAAAAKKAQDEVDAVELRADALEQKVGQDKTDSQPATGLFAEVDKVADDLALEVTRASAAEVANTRAIEVLDGRMDQAESDIDALQAKFVGDDSIENKIAAVQANVEKHYEDEAKENQKLQAAIDKKVAQADYDAKVQALELADSGLAERVAAFEGDENKAGSVKQQIKAAVDAIDGDMTVLEGRVAANEGKLAGLENATVKAEIEAAQAAAEKHADDAITALVDSAPEAMDTLKELADAIKTHGTEYEAYVATVTANIATAKQEAIDAAATAAADKDDALKALLQKEIDDDVKAEADRAKGEEARIEAAYKTADTALHTTISAEIDADVKAEADRAKGVEQGLQAAIDVLNGADDKEGSVAKAVKDAVGVENQRALAQEAAIRQEFTAADSVLDGRIKTLEGLVVGGEGEGLEAVISDVAENKEDIKDLKEFVAGHDHAQMIADIDANAKAIAQEVQDRKDAVAKEVLDRNQAIADALKAYTTSKEMMTILGNVVNSLALTMEDNKMVLKLGGVEGVAIHEASLDMATDDDIQAIIDGLDA